MPLRTFVRSASRMSQPEIDAVIALCSAVFHLDYADYMDLCPVRDHVLGYVGERLVAHALWLRRRLRIGEGPWLNAAYIEGVATHADFRKLGYGSAVMRHVQEAISGFDLAGLGASVPEWYERLGWERWRGPLWIDKGGELQETPGECVMVYRTPKTGAIDLSAQLTAEWRPFELW